MKRISNFIIIFTLILFVGCQKEVDLSNVELIKLNPIETKNEMKLSEIVDSVKYIKLQTKGCEMGRLHDIIIKEKYIYALDVSQMILFVFDKNGNYVSKLDKRGRGPDEYFNMGPVFIDDNEEFVEIINYNGSNTSLLKYSNISFNLKNTRPIPRIGANSCNRLGDTLYFASQQIENIINGKSTNAGIIILDKGNNVEKLFDKKINTNNSGYAPFGESFTKNNNGDLFVSIPFDNTFYKISGMKAEPVYTIDFGKYGIDNSIGMKSINEQMEYLKNVNGLASFPVLNINNSDIMAVSYWFKTSEDRVQFYKPTDLYQYIKLKKDGSIYHTKKIKNDITNFPDDINLTTYSRHVNHEVWYKDYLVDVVLPAYYFTEEKMSMIVDSIGEVTIQDNPIIILAKLKK